MRKIFTILFFVGFCCKLSAQYYIRGSIKDEKNQPLQNVKIFLHSSRMLYLSGATGTFGILTPVLYDSITLNAEGYEPRSIKVKADAYQDVVLKMLFANVSVQKQTLVSITKDLDPNASRNLMFGNESYSNLVENNFIRAEKYPATGFSVRADKASYSNIRRFINQKSAVPVDAVRIDEMLNYFNLKYKEPEKGEVFRISSQLTACPWNNNNQLVMIDLSAKKIDLEKVPASNFVFLIDVSGSMDLPNRLPLLKASFQSLVKNLRDKDTVSIVTYGGGVKVWLTPTGGIEKRKIIRSIEELTAAGDTPGEAAVKAAYQLARSSFIEGGNNRVILATDGDFNVGQTSEKELEELISKERLTGIYLTCLGVGMGNYKDSKIEALAKKGNGNFAYIDDIKEGEKVLVKELTQTLYTVANDVFLNVHFNREMVKEYRLIGYDNKKNVLSDSLSKLEGGEIGSGSGITAIFEIVPTDDNLFSSDPFLNEDIATLQLNYKLPGDSTQKMCDFICTKNFKEFYELDNETRFTTAITMFGLLLRHSKYASYASFNEVEKIAKASLNKNDYLQTEFIELVDKAKKIYSKKNKKKNEFN